MTGEPVTRRALLGGAAAAGTGLLLGPVAGALAGRRPGDRVWGHWVGGLAGESPALQAPRRFALAGVQWSSPMGAAIEIRTRTHDGQWSRWAPASVTGHDGDPTAATSGASFGEPLWVGAADIVQLRSRSAVRGVVIHFVAARPSPTRAEAAAASVGALALATPTLHAGPGQPPIIARSAWAGNHAPPAGSAFYGEIKLAFVHHTVNPNGYGPGEVPGMLLAIFDYHRYVRGFFDIGYNFVVDAFGRIWEARAGGIDEPVIGAQAGAYNAESTGAAVLGTFDSVVPSAAAIDALEHLLAWKLALHGVPSIGEVRVEVDPSDAYYTPFRPGQMVLLPRVAGHRQGDLTSCPGDAFFAHLPSIRPRVAALEGVPAVLTLAAAPSQTVAPGTQISLSGKLAMLGGAPVGGAAIQVQRLANDQATTIVTATTASDGTWSVPLPAPLQRNIVLRALRAAAPAATSNVVYVGVEPVITLTLASQSPVRVSGTISPAKPHVTLDSYHVARNGHRHLLHSKQLPVVGGQFSARALIGAHPGTYILVARSSAGRGTIAGASPPLTVVV